jgi:hypothetical protein
MENCSDFINSHGPDAGCDCCSEDTSGESLWPYIDMSKIKIYNAVSGYDKGENFVKAFNERKDVKKWLESEEDDPELLIYIPFTLIVNLSAISIHGDIEHGPNEIRAFKNKDNINFQEVYDIIENEKWECINPIEIDESLENIEFFHTDVTGQSGYIVDYAVRRHKWQHISSITLHIPESLSLEDSIKIFYLGFKGSPTKTNTKTTTVDCVYEAMPQPDNNKTLTSNMGKYFV